MLARRQPTAKRGLLFRIQPLGSKVPAVPEKRCRRSGKRCFDTAELARQQADEWAGHNASDYEVYECQCGAYHLTHRNEGSLVG